jgi:hypothetical protein
MFIERCVQSVIDQMGGGDELVLVDDGSADNSGLSCDWFRRCYGDCVKVIHQENKGLSEARNAGIREATGDYIVLLDSDDWLMRGALAQIRSILSKRRADVLIGKFRAYQMPPRDKVVDDPANFDKQLGGDELDTERICRGIFENNMMFTAWRNVVNREFIKRNALMFEPGILHEDEEWCPRLYTSARSFALNPKPFYAYRLREGSIVYTKTWRKTLGLFAATQTVSGLIKQYPELGKGLALKRDELAGRALQTLPQFDDDSRARLFESLPKYPAMSRYILLLKGNGAKQADPSGTGESTESFDKIVSDSDDGELLAKWALVAYYTMVRGAREAAAARRANPAGTAAPGNANSPPPNPPDNIRPASAQQPEPTRPGSPACSRPC